MRGLLELTRPTNAIAAGLLPLIGGIVAGGTTHPTLLTAAIAATILGTGAGNTINDYFDREVDAINRPTRPIPRGAVSPRQALALTAVLFTAALALTATLPVPAIAIALVNLVALVTYTQFFKGTPGLGNLLVGYLVGSAFLFGAAATHNTRAAAILFVLAALATITREIIKDVEDRPGDEAEGLTTLPTTIGDTKALHVGTAALTIAIAASPVPYLLGQFGPIYILAVIPADALMAYGAYRAYTDPASGQQALKLGMFVATVAFVVGRLASWAT
ncbi:MAG: geranylgeranylglycerol-phosphate geranylgeranyltransferase [Natrialbaceae archaeon]|nr:geranylgeranylglycerol-phosphate geranylgeranyltransferase [Natrialbaceae archaeon]